MRLTLGTIFTASPIFALVAVLVIALGSTPAIADLEAVAKTCSSGNIPPKEHLVACRKIIDSETLNQKQMVVALYALGHTQLVLGDAEQDIDSFGQAIEIAPDELGLILSRSQAYLGLRRFKAAIADLTHAIVLKPEVAPFYSNRGNAYAGLGNHRQALKYFDESIRRNPTEFAQPYIRRGRSLMATGAHQKAIYDFTKAIEIGHANLAPVHMYRGTAYAQVGRNAPALEDFREALRQSPDLVEANFHRGNLRVRLNNRALARADFETVVARIPNHIGAQYALAAIDQTDGKYESAIKRYDVILGLAPNNPVMLNNRCYVKRYWGERVRRFATATSLCGCGRVIRLFLIAVPSRCSEAASIGVQSPITTWSSRQIQTMRSHCMAVAMPTNGWVQQRSPRLISRLLN